MCQNVCSTDKNNFPWQILYFNTETTKMPIPEKMEMSQLYQDHSPKQSPLVPSNQTLQKHVNLTSSGQNLLVKVYVARSVLL